MKYAHILLAVASEFWAIDEYKLDQIVSFLALQASGEKLSAEEVQARISRQEEQNVARREGVVAILPYRGVTSNRMSMMTDISGGLSYEAFGRRFDAAVADPEVKAIIADVDSPGGVVSGVDELSQKIHAARGKKPIVAHVNSTMASAAVWAWSAADEIWLSPSAEAGSIGVLQIHDDITAALEKAGIKRTIIAAGKYKGEGWGALSEEAIAHRNARAEAYHTRFIERIAGNRGVTVEHVRENFGKGRMLLAEDAVAARMADGIASLEATISRFTGAPVTSPVSRRPLAIERERLALGI